jgi:hypothetical protein
MANGHGGQRTPANPAPVSGPGAGSARTDGGPGQPIRDPGGLAYGDGQELRTQQASAPMSGGRQASVPTGGGLADLLNVGTTPISAGTQYPNEPLTAGVAAGPGAGPEVLASSAKPAGPTRTKLMSQLPVLMRMADQPDTSPEFRTLVRYLRSTI